MSSWYTADTPEEIDRLAGAWSDAPDEDTEQLGMILDTARQQVIAYAPTPGEDDDLVNDPPARYVYAQLQQTINLWNAGRAGSDGTLGVDTYTFTPRPLDKTIRTIIRPIDVKPNVY